MKKILFIFCCLLFSCQNPIKTAFFDKDTKIIVGVYTSSYITKRAERKDHKLEEVELAHKITLNEKQKITLFNLLYERKCDQKEADCYTPRHFITFYKGNKETAHIEICFDCRRSRSSLPQELSCDASDHEVKVLFDSIGLPQPTN